MQWLRTGFKVKVFPKIIVGNRTSYVISPGLRFSGSIIYSVIALTPMQNLCMWMSLFSTNEVTVKTKDRILHSIRT